MSNALHISAQNETGKYKTNQVNTFERYSKKMRHNQRKIPKKVVNREWG